MFPGAAFMFVLALTDLLAVGYDGIIDMFLFNLGTDFAAMSDYSCKLLKLFSWVTTIASYYVISLLSIDKCLAVWVPGVQKLIVFENYYQDKLEASGYLPPCIVLATVYIRGFSVTIKLCRKILKTLKCLILLALFCSFRHYFLWKNLYLLSIYIVECSK